MRTPTLIERIHEAAFVPEAWSDVLDRVCRPSDSASGQFCAFSGREMTAWRSTARGREGIEEFFSVKGWLVDEWHPDMQVPAMPEGEYFNLHQDLTTPAQLAGNLSHRMRDRAGLNWQVAAPIPLPTGQTIAFTFDRRKAQGPHDAECIALFNALHPHLGRSGALAIRLGLQRAPRGALAALTALDLPAALLDRKGRLCEANALLKSSALLDTRGDGRVALGDPSVDALLAAALDGAMSPHHAIPLPAHGARPARVWHIVALPDAVRNPLASATHLLVLKTAGAAVAGQRSSLLLDLSPAESRLAGRLATGIDLAQAASQCGIRFSTARSNLKKIFQKTGCHRQGELIALLGRLTAPPAPSDNES